MGTKSTVRRSLGRAGRLIPLAAALLLAALVSIPSSGVALAQGSGDGIVLVNADREFVERKGGGEFVARPVFDRKIVSLFFAVRDADTGDWISAMYRVSGGEKKRSRRLGVLVGVSRPGRAARPRPGPGLPARDAGPIRGRHEGRLLCRRPHPPAGAHLGQDSVRPQPRTLGESLRRVDDRGRPRHPLRSCRAGVRRRRRQLPGRVAADDRHHHRHPSRTDLRPLAGPGRVDCSLGRHLRRPDGHPGLDGPQLHRERAPGQPPGGVAGDGTPPRPGTGGRRIVPLVVRPGHRRGRRRVRLHRRHRSASPPGTCCARP